MKGLEGAERAKKLAAMAKAEGGELTFYTSLVSDTEEAVADEFEDAYDVEVSVYRASGETVAQRVSEEAEPASAEPMSWRPAGRRWPGWQGRAFVRYRPDGADELVKGSVHQDWTAVRFNTFVVAWNTKLVPKERCPAPTRSSPTTLEGQAGDRGAGRRLVQGDARIPDGGGQERGRGGQGAEGIAANAQVATSHSLMTQLLSAGEFALAPDQYQYQVKDAQDNGAPLEAEPFVEPVFSRPQGMGLMNTAKHPAAAVLFADWLVGPGQKVLLESNTEAPQGPQRTQSAERRNIDVEEFEAQTKEWDDRYAKVISGTPKAPEPE